MIALSGPLGSGKTSFARAFIRARGLDAAEVPSPTFMLVEIYDGDAAIAGLAFRSLPHREARGGCASSGIEEALAEGICLIEWPERLGEFLPDERLDLALAMGSASRARGPALRLSRLGKSGSRDSAR